MDSLVRRLLSTNQPPENLNQATPAEVDDDFVVLHALSTLHRTQIPQKAIMTIAHPSRRRGRAAWDPRGPATRERTPAAPSRPTSSTQSPPHSVSLQNVDTTVSVCSTSGGACCSRDSNRARIRNHKVVRSLGLITCSKKSTSALSAARSGDRS